LPGLSDLFCCPC